MTTKKKSGALAAFAATGESEPTKKQAAPKRSRGVGEVVALSVRLKRNDWKRVHELALSEGVSIHSLLIDGLSKAFIERGLPPLT